MRLSRSTRGQQTAEYAVLFAIVVGTAIAVQAVIKSRLQASIGQRLGAYETAATSSGLKFEPVRTTLSQSATDLTMETSKKGGVASLSGSQSSSDKAAAPVTK